MEQLLEMNEKKFTISKWRFVSGLILRTLLICFVISVLWEFVNFFVIGVFFHLFRKVFEYPYNLVLSAMLALICQICKITTVKVTKTGVSIKKQFRKPVFLSLDSYSFEPYQKLGSKKLKNELLFLRVVDHKGVIKDYRLFFFSKSKYTELISAINAADTEAVPTEIRAEAAFEDLRDGKVEYVIPREKIIRAEWHWYIRYSAIIVVLTVALFLMRDWGGGLTYYAGLCAGIIMVFGIPVVAVRLFLNQKICPAGVSRYGTFIYFDDCRFSVSKIEKIVITSPTAVSHSVYPKNRYIKVVTEGRQTKYWLGSDCRLFQWDYKELCGEIERMFINQASKVVYDQK